MLNFGPRGSSMVTIPLERLEAGVEYTFNLIVWKAGRKEEATNQTVGCAPDLSVWPHTRTVPAPTWFLSVTAVVAPRAVSSLKPSADFGKLPT